jgi:hypothetical protein
VIDSPWFYNFLNQGYLADRKRDTSVMNLGTTYDSASATVPDTPHPINFHQTDVWARENGSLHFVYAWDSSTGNLDGLNCVVGEIVTYPGGNPYNWPAPMNRSTDNPTAINISARAGGLDDDHFPPYSFTTPYREASFKAVQRYRYRCDGSAKFINLTGSITITRSVTQNADGTFAYMITKSGSPATINPLP